ncbi:4-coumarate--CoA ligase [Ranunculus cassubicifolius]
MAEELYSAKGNSECEWFDSRTGIYKSKYKSINLPKTQFLDVVSFIFSFKHNGSSALIHHSSGYSLSYSNLHQMVNSFASGLHHLGVSKGDVVLILLPNTVYFPIILLGVLSVGAIAMPMNPLSSSIEIDKRVKDCNVTLIFTENVEKVEHLNVRVRVIRVPLVENIVECELQTSEFDCFNRLVSSNPRTWTTPEINQEDTAAILYSSGTSGVSKGVVLTHKNLISVIEVFVRFEALQSSSIYPVLENVYLAIVPMFHVYGLSLFSLGLLSLGSTIVVMRNYNIEEMLRTIDTYRVTHLPIVPPILMDLTRAKSKGRCHLKSVKQVSFGAAPSSRKLIQDFAQGFPHVDLIQGYGMTESSAVGTRGLNTAKFRKYTSVGLLQPNLQAKVVDLDSGLCLPPGLSGELRLVESR